LGLKKSFLSSRLYIEVEASNLWGDSLTMLFKVASASLAGIEAELVEVEVDAFVGLPGLILVGLPDASIRESRERVRAALINCGYALPRKKLIINLAPADRRKEGSSFDVPIAVGLLAHQGVFPVRRIKDYLFMGELALDGHLKPVRGVLSAAFLAQRQGFQGLVIPKENLPEASLISGLRCYGLSSLGEIIEFLRDPQQFVPADSFLDHFSPDVTYQVDFQDVRGQHQAKRALEIAAAGGHNLLMVGPPGAGKTMLARRLPSILPPMTEEEIIEVTRIYSVAGLLAGGQIIVHRPFRSPHHSVTAAGLIGGGTIPRPGEVSLAHRGVLFLDELVEYKRQVLENLRQPLEDGCVTISRLHSRVTFPSSFMLVAAMNSFEESYTVLANSSDYYLSQKARFFAPLSKPLLDRIDLQIEVPKISFQELTSMSQGEGSAQIRERVVAAREQQIQRFKRERIWSNAQMNLTEIKQYCRLDAAGERLMERAMENLNLSARAFVKILKVARTIADLEGDNSSLLNPVFLAEAIQYRLFDKNE